jgi:hypothetical protein
MKEIREGGPAFPVSSYCNSAGMTLRDYFAAMAMQGQLTGTVGVIGVAGEPTPYVKGGCNSAIAERAYAMADAMLTAKNVYT